jgi:hypothetical protein
MRNRREIDKNKNCILVSKKGEKGGMWRKKRGYGEIGRRYGLTLD